MLSTKQLRTFARDGYLLVPGVVEEALLAELDAEVNDTIDRDPPPADKVGFHHYFRDWTSTPVAERVLREGGVLDLARELVAPLPIDWAFDQVQFATSIQGWDHQPGGGHIDGYGMKGQTAPFTFTLLAGVYLDDESAPGRGNIWVWPGSHLGHQQLFRERGLDVLLPLDGHACMLRPAPDWGRGQPVLARRGDVLLAHYLLAHNQSGNLGHAIPLRRIVYYRLAAEGHRQRWTATHTDALLEFQAVRQALHPPEGE